MSKIYASVWDSIEDTPEMIRSRTNFLHGLYERTHKYG